VGAIRCGYFVVDGLGAGTTLLIVVSLFLSSESGGNPSLVSSENATLEIIADDNKQTPIGRSLWSFNSECNNFIL
jgi:hypothetical protein